ncbi:hypothetical protein [Klebsiella phage vB_KpnS-VAC35]|uniref:Uncharacterized protein n=1 Tax=Klebsiella phage vB_KpnS-VAC35 TaxID=2866696 RepID=A0AAE8YDE7_9CAUD|nr:hypothetical protein [Klebsiella phage vB_KpnS-VAC35]
MWELCEAASSSNEEVTIPPSIRKFVESVDF